VSVDILDDLKQEAINDNKNEVITLAGSVKDNLQKVVYHGKRADAIVKSMLEHSRRADGEKQYTDMNSLVEQHLRLAYHGYRAKDKEFSTNLTTNYDPAVGKLNAGPQDIGRVLLNLLNNSFYSVNEKKKQRNGTYEPLISVTTKKVNNSVEISVKDNGTGIPQKILAKIYQPFFTTKPPGEGTGLGLSLSYDIVKAHGGSIKVDSKEGEYSEFIVSLPV
jgi:signal transduction histidine kinase